MVEEREQRRGVKITRALFLYHSAYFFLWESCNCAVARLRGFRVEFTGVNKNAVKMYYEHIQFAEALKINLIVWYVRSDSRK